VSNTHDWKTVHREQHQWTDGSISIWQECTRCKAVRSIPDKVQHTTCPTCGHSKVVDGTTGIAGAHEWVARSQQRGESAPCP
jgi:hypothetical protein